MAGLIEFYCGWNEPSHASQFKWLEYTFKDLFYCFWVNTKNQDRAKCCFAFKPIIFKKAHK